MRRGPKNRIHIPQLDQYPSADQIEFSEIDPSNDGVGVFITRSLGLASYLYMNNQLFVKSDKPGDDGNTRFSFPYTDEMYNELQKLISDYVSSESYQHDLTVMQLRSYKIKIEGRSRQR